MFRFLVRTLGLWCLAGSFAAAVIDGMKSIAGSGLRMTTLTETWNDLAPATLVAARAFVEARAGAGLWSTLDTALRFSPTWIVFAILGSLLIALARPRAEPVGVTP